MDKKYIIGIGALLGVVKAKKTLTEWSKIDEEIQREKLQREEKLKRQRLQKEKEEKERRISRSKQRQRSNILNRWEKENMPFFRKDIANITNAILQSPKLRKKLFKQFPFMRYVIEQDYPSNVVTQVQDDDLLYLVIRLFVTRNKDLIAKSGLEPQTNLRPPLPEDELPNSFDGSPWEIVFIYGRRKSPPISEHSLYTYMEYLKETKGRIPLIEWIEDYDLEEKYLEPKWDPDNDAEIRLLKHGIGTIDNRLRKTTLLANPTRPVKAPPMGRSRGELYRIGVTDLQYLGTDFINNGKNEARIFRGYWMGDRYQYAVYRQKRTDRIYTKRKSI